jgi:hypothetical protein
MGREAGQGLFATSPKTSFYRPEGFTIDPGLLTVYVCFSPKISPESPASSHLQPQNPAMKEYFGSESLNLLNQESLRTPILVDNQEMPSAYQSENATGTQDQDTKGL